MKGGEIIKAMGGVRTLCGQIARSLAPLAPFVRPVLRFGRTTNAILSPFAATRNRISKKYETLELSSRLDFFAETKIGNGRILDGFVRPDCFLK